MYISARLHRSRRIVPAICAPLALATVLAAAPAQADITATAQFVNNFGTSFDPSQTPQTKQGGTKETVYLGNYTTGTQSELGVNYTGIADQNGFFFLHDNYCVGACATASDTTIGFVVTNNSDGLENVRFDSQITPGHLAKIYHGNGQAGFTFEVLRFNDGFQTLYSASGTVGPRGIFLNTGDLEFNGLRRQTGENYDLLDWDTTNLSVNVGSLSGGSSTLVIYRATYWALNDAECADVFVCDGNQVVFGDPRNNGGTNLADLTDELNAVAGRAVIGADYGAVLVPFKFVRDDAPFSFEQPQPGAELVYDPLYRSRVQGVPEPASWALMISGFGLAGAAMRRRRPSVAFA